MELKTAWINEPWMCGVFQLEPAPDQPFGHIDRKYSMLVFTTDYKQVVAEFVLEISVAGTFWGATLPGVGHENYGPEFREVDLETFVNRAKSWITDNGSRLGQTSGTTVSDNH
jgi:hypothetical protein